VTGKLANYFQEARRAKGLTVEGLARTVPCENVRKTATRIAMFEQGGPVHDDLLVALAEALGIDLPTVEELLEQDRHG
jgi:transcriptional regulator with XRE-family HTH domain